MLEPSPALSRLVLQNIYANSKNRYCLRPPREIQRYNRSGRRGFNWLVHYNIQQSISMHADDVSNVVCSKLANQTASLRSKVHFNTLIHLSIFWTNLSRDRWSVTKCFSERKSTKRRKIAEGISPPMKHLSYPVENVIKQLIQEILILVWENKLGIAGT